MRDTPRLTATWRSHDGRPARLTAIGPSWWAAHNALLAALIAAGSPAGVRVRHG